MGLEQSAGGAVQDISVRFGPGELEAAAARLDGRPAIGVIEWASERFGTRLVFATAFGPAGCVLVDMIGRRQLPIDIFTLDTGLFFEETYVLWRSLENRYELTVRQVTPATSLTQQARKYGGRLWQRNPDLCCSIRKVAPMEAELSRADAWISSIRRAQTPERAQARVVKWDQRFQIAKINPLVHWTKHEVWRYIRTHRVPHNPLHNHGYPSIGCWPCMSAAGSEESDRAGRWRNRAKNECELHGRLVLTNGEAHVPCAL